MEVNVRIKFFETPTEISKGPIFKPYMYPLLPPSNFIYKQVFVCLYCSEHSEQCAWIYASKYAYFSDFSHYTAKILIE